MELEVQQVMSDLESANSCRSSIFLRLYEETMENSSNGSENAQQRVPLTNHDSPTIVVSSPNEEEPPSNENSKDYPHENNANISQLNDDPFHLDRFIRTQRIMMPTALSEISVNGEKQSCWLWFVLPTAPYIVNGVERGSTMNQHYALRSNEECIAYLSCVTSDGMSLRHNYVDMLQAIQKQLIRGNTMRRMFGPLDDVKAISSFCLFQRVAKLMDDDELEALCRNVLELASTSSKGKRSMKKKKSRLLNTKSL